METSLNKTPLIPTFYHCIATCFVAVLILSSCGKTSRRGSWSETDKGNAKKELQKAEVNLEYLGCKKAAFVSCYLEKLEAHYSNLEEANLDEVGCTKLATACLNTLNKNEKKQ